MGLRAEVDGKAPGAVQREVLLRMQDAGIFAKRTQFSSALRCAAAGGDLQETLLLIRETKPRTPLSLDIIEGGRNSAQSKGDSVGAEISLSDTHRCKIIAPETTIAIKHSVSK